MEVHLAELPEEIPEEGPLADDVRGIREPIQLDPGRSDDLCGKLPGEIAEGLILIAEGKVGFQIAHFSPPFDDRSGRALLVAGPFQGLGLLEGRSPRYSVRTRVRAQP